MTTSTLSTAPPSMTAYDDPPGRIARLAPWLASLWAAGFGALALLNLALGTTPPWRPDPASLLAPASTEQVAVLVAGLALVAALGLGTVVRARRGETARLAAWLLVGLGLVVALVLTGARTLAFLGYAPMLLLGLFGIGPAAAHGIDPADLAASVLSLGSTLGGLGMVVTGARVLGRRGRMLAAQDPARARARAVRVGGWAVVVAVLVPLAYAATRLAWAVGVPLGVRPEFLDELGDGKWAGLGLAAFAVVGCLLTLGLVQRWGEVFWSWVPRIGGRPVPVGMAVVPALLVATAVTGAGLGFWAAVLNGHLADLPGAEQDWAAWAPETLWPLWGAALAVAALAYRARRAVTR